MTDDDIANARATIARAHASYVTRPLSTCLDGWSAAIDEVERLRAERTSDIEMWRATESDLALNHRRADEAEAEVERLTKLKALAESGLHSAHDATKALVALADRYFEAKEPLEVVADAARALVAAFDRDAFELPPVLEGIRGLRRALAGAPIPPEVAKLMADDRPAGPELHDAVAAVIRLARKSANPRQSLHEAVDALDAARIDLGEAGE